MFTGGNVQFDFINGFHASEGDYWDFLLANSITGWGAINSFMVDGLDNGLVWRINAIDGGQRLSIAKVSTVPLPATIWLLAPALAGIGLFRRRKA